MLEEGLVGGLKTAEHVTVGGGGHCQVGECIGGFGGESLHGVVGLLESGGLGSGTEVSKVGMGKGKLGFEELPGLLDHRGAMPLAAGFVEGLGAKHDGVGVVDDLPG